MNKQQLIKEINHHFPSYEAVDGLNFGECEENTIFFLGEESANNLNNDFLVHHDEFGEYTIDESKGEGCPVNKYLNNVGWYVEMYDENTAYAVKDNLATGR